MSRIASPHPFQYVGAYHCIFNDNTYLVVSHKTLEGKTLVPQLVGALQRSVFIHVEPLLGLNSNQVERDVVVEHNIEDYHGDEHTYKDQSLLIKQLNLLNAKEAQHVTMNFFIEPKLMTSQTWWLVLKSSKQGIISLFCQRKSFFSLLS